MPPILKTKTGSEILGDNKLAYDVSSFFEGLGLGLCSEIRDNLYRF